MEFANRDPKPGKARRLLTQFAKIIGIGLLILFVFSLVFPVKTCGCNSPIASCQSNLKQIGLALMQYSQDNDGALPNYAEVKGSQTWREALYPYTKAAGLYECPDDSRNRNTSAADIMPASYAANAGLFAGPGAKPAHLSGSTTTIAVADARGYAGGEWNMISPAFLPTTGRTLFAHTRSHAFYQHPIGTINCLMGDGHVKALVPERMIAPINYWTHDNAPFTGRDLTNAQAILHGATTN